MITEESFNVSITNIDNNIISYINDIIISAELPALELKFVHRKMDGGVCKPLFDNDGCPTQKFLIEIDSKIIKNTHFIKYLLLHEISHAYQVLEYGHMKHDESFYSYFKKIVPREFWSYEKQFNKNFNLE